MNRLGGSARHLTHSLSGSACRCGKQHLKLPFFKKLQNPVERGRFSRSRSARQNKQAVPHGGQNRFPLFFFESDALCLFDFVDVRFNRSALGRRKFQHHLDTVGGVFFGMIDTGKEQKQLAGKLLTNKLLVFHKVVNNPFRLFTVTA